MNTFPHIFCNSTTGSHSEGNITFTAEAPFNERYLFAHVRSGRLTSPAGKGNITSGRRAIGIATDTAASKDSINIQIFGSNTSTLKVIAGSVITTGDLLTSDASSKATNYQTEPSGAYFIYGIALTDAQPAQLVEFTPTPGLEKTTK